MSKASRYALISVIIFAIYAALSFRPDLFFNTRNENNLKEVLDKNDTSKETYCFAYASDCRDNMKVLEKLVEKVNQDPEIEWLIFGGDTVYNCDLKEYRNFMNVTDQLNVPMITLPGNHEMRGMGQLLYRFYYGRVFYSFIYKQDQFILMDNSSESHFGIVQKLWLKYILKKYTSAKNRFVFFHVPLYDQRTIMHGDGIADENMREAKSMERILSEYSIQQVFSSHLHGFYQGKWGELSYTISAGAGAPLHAEPKENSFFNYVKVYVSPQSYDIQVVRI